MRSGILIAILGTWLVLRTVRQDDSQRNLVDYLTGKPADGQPGAGGSSNPGKTLTGKLAGVSPDGQFHPHGPVVAGHVRVPGTHIRVPVGSPALGLPILP